MQQAGSGGGARLACVTAPSIRCTARAYAVNSRRSRPPGPPPPPSPASSHQAPAAPGRVIARSRAATAARVLGASVHSVKYSRYRRNSSGSLAVPSSFSRRKSASMAASPPRRRRAPPAATAASRPLPSSSLPALLAMKPLRPSEPSDGPPLPPSSGISSSLSPASSRTRCSAMRATISPARARGLTARRARPLPDAGSGAAAADGPPPSSSSSRRASSTAREAGRERRRRERSPPSLSSLSRAGRAPPAGTSSS